MSTYMEYSTPDRSAQPERFVLSNHSIYPAHDKRATKRLPSYDVIKKLGLWATEGLSSHNDTVRSMRAIMRERYLFDNDNMLRDKTINPLLAQDVSSLYGLLAQDIDRLDKETASYALQERVHENSIVYRGLIGSATESSVMALLSKDLVGTEADDIVVLPATTRQDRANYDSDGYNHGFDARVIYRHDNDPIDLQIKTTQKGAEEKLYHPRILVTSLELIAGGIKRITHLEHAIIDHVNGTANEQQLEHIQSSHDYLFDALQTHRNKLAHNDV